MMPAPSRSIFGFGGSSKGKNGGGSTIKLISTPSNLWSEDNLDKIYSEEFLKNNFDHNFRKMVSEYGRARRYLPPDIDKIKEFCNECRDMKILTQSMNMQAKKTKQILQTKYDSFFVDKYHIYNRTYPNMVSIVEYEFRKLPISFKTRSQDELNQQISQLRTYKNAIVSKMVKDSIRD